MNNKSPHILTTSSNLLGFTFLVLSSIKSMGFPNSNIVDDVVALCIIIFAISSTLSFVAIQTQSSKRSQMYEMAAEYVFLVGLLLVTIVSGLFAFDVITFT